MSAPVLDRAELALLAIPAQLIQLRSVGGHLAGEVRPPCPLRSWLETTMLEGTGTTSCVDNCICPSEKAKYVKNNGRWKVFS